MSAYQYVAIKKSGQNLKGVIQADSERHARQLLREKGLIPIEVGPLQKSLTIKKPSKKISAADLCLLTRQLATLLAAGIPVEDAIHGVAEQANKTHLKHLLIGLRAKVTEGYSLAQALNEYPRVFPTLYRATVAAGEQTGRLDEVLEKLADHTENQHHIQQKIQQALIYPSLMILVATAILSFLLAFVVPNIIDVFARGGQSLPMATKILISISHFIHHKGLFMIVLLVLGGISVQQSLKRPAIKLRWDQNLLKIPMIAYFIRSTNVARYIHTFSILFAAGVNVLETLSVAANLVKNNIMRQAFDKAAIQIKEGSNISQALQGTGFLSPMAIHLIASGEKSGQLATMMEHAAKHLDNEVKRLIDTGLTLLEPLIILLMGGMVLFIVLATLLPIFSMEQLIN